MRTIYRRGTEGEEGRVGETIFGACRDMRRRLVRSAVALKVLESMNERGGVSPAQIDALVAALAETGEAILRLIRLRNRLPGGR
jgi:hypothetical protein